MEPQATKSRNWGRIGDGAVLMVYSGVVLWTLQYHEKWADEAQAWLIARDLDLGTIWFHELRYEGSPGLWHTILWVAQHVFHAPYGALGYIGAVFAIAGAAVLLFLAPFPRLVRWPLAFTYFMVYQYAVIARPYTLLPLLAFLAALLFKDVKHPEWITVVLVLLSLLTLHGTLLAGCLGLAYLTQAYKNRDELDGASRKRYAYSIGAMALTFVLIITIVKPTEDVEMIALRRELANAPSFVTEHFPSVWQKLTAVICGAFIDWLIPSILLIILLAAWCIWRRQWFAFVVPVVALILFYGQIHGAAHHHGTVFVAAITGVWIAWPSNEERIRLASRGRDRWLLYGGVALLLLLCAFNLVDAEVAIHHEYLYPYSGAEDAAAYLKAVGADRGPMFGFLHGVVAIQAYFDHNVFVNGPHSYFHHGLPLTTTVLNKNELNRTRPEYVVVYSDDPQMMMQIGAPQLVANGYELAHFSDGYYIYKQGVYEREVYFIFRRVSQAGDLAAQQNGTTTKDDGRPQ
jgi:hypothetical protein